jgi:hypothetical protein
MLISMLRLERELQEIIREIQNETSREIRNIELESCKKNKKHTATI